MDVRLTHSVIREMKRKSTLDSRVLTRGPSAEWATIPLEDDGDVELALQLVDLAIDANS